MHNNRNLEAPLFACTLCRLRAQAEQQGYLEPGAAGTWGLLLLSLCLGP
jgi:hypothetical protein